MSVSLHESLFAGPKLLSKDVCTSNMSTGTTSTDDKSSDPLRCFEVINYGHVYFHHFQLS